MADDQDKSQKTEDPTGKRLGEAFEKGNVPKSQEVSHWFMLAAAALVIAMFSGDIAQGLGGDLKRYLELAHAMPVDEGQFYANFRDLGFQLMWLLFLPISLLVVAAIAGNLVQHKPVFTFEKMKPELSKISPLKGMARFASPKPFIDLAKAILKIGLIGGVAAALILPDLSGLTSFAQMDLIDIGLLVRRETLIMLATVIVIMAAIAAIDLVYQRYDWFQNLKMSKQDVRDENKQSEGDPQVKARIRQVRAERARARVMAAVPTADVVVTNPTHFAVALKYDGDKMAAPRLVAKGQDHLALRIRELAKENDVPIVENPPLARGLYRSVELDQEIPPEFYKAVAEIIGYVYRLKGRMSKGGGSARP